MPQVDIERLQPSIVEQHQARAEYPAVERPLENTEIYNFDPKDGFEDITMKGNIPVTPVLHMLIFIILQKNLPMYINSQILTI